MEHFRKVPKTIIFHRLFELIPSQTCATRHHTSPTLRHLLRAKLLAIHDDTLTSLFHRPGSDPSGLSWKGVLVKSHSQALVKRWLNFGTPDFIKEFLYKWINFEQFWTILIVSNIFSKTYCNMESLRKKLQTCHISSVFCIFSEEIWIFVPKVIKTCK